MDTYVCVLVHARTHARTHMGMHVCSACMLAFTCTCMSTYVCVLMYTIHVHLYACIPYNAFN